MGYNKMYSRPFGYNMVEENGKIWMSLLNRNGICEVDKVSRRARICRIFEDEPLDQEYLYCNVEKMDDYLIFPPGLAKKIAIYDLKNDHIIYIPLKEIKCDHVKEEKNVKLWNIFKYRSDVYMFGATYPAIIKIDMRSMKVDYITKWLKKIDKKYQFGNTIEFFSDGHVIIDDLALIPVVCMNAVLELNLKTNHMEFKKLNISMKGIGGLSSFDGENIWLVGREKDTDWVSCWNRKTDTIKEIHIDDIDGNLCEPFHAPLCTDSKIFLMPVSAHHIYEIEMRGEKTKIRNITDDYFADTGNLIYPLTTIAPRLEENKLKFITGADLKWHEYDIETNEFKSGFIHMQEEKNEIDQYFDAVYQNNKEKAECNFESRISIEYFLSKILETDFGRSYNNMENILCKKNIFDLMKKECI